MKKDEMSLGQIRIGKELGRKTGGDERLVKFIINCLRRHARGDSENMSKEDGQKNKFLKKQGWVCSVYPYKKRKIWILT